MLTCATKSVGTQRRSKTRKLVIFWSAFWPALGNFDMDEHFLLACLLTLAIGENTVRSTSRSVCAHITA